MYYKVLAQRQLTNVRGIKGHVPWCIVDTKDIYNLKKTYPVRIIKKTKKL